MLYWHHTGEVRIDSSSGCLLWSWKCIPTGTHSSLICWCDGRVAICTMHPLSKERKKVFCCWIERSSDKLLWGEVHITTGVREYIPDNERNKRSLRKKRFLLRNGFSHLLHTRSHLQLPPPPYLTISNNNTRLVFRITNLEFFWGLVVALHVGIRFCSVWLKHNLISVIIPIGTFVYLWTLYTCTSKHDQKVRVNQLRREYLIRLMNELFSPRFLYSYYYYER